MICMCIYYGSFEQVGAGAEHTNLVWANLQLNFKKGSGIVYCHNRIIYIGNILNYYQNYKGNSEIPNILRNSFQIYVDHK